MRIISGSRRGRKLFDFEGDDIRPTTDRVKESMFNIITPFVAEAHVLDLFCGSGALSVEAVSRGARTAVCVDKDTRSLELAKKNVKSVDFDECFKFVHSDAMSYLEKTEEKFDVVFLDPPYNKGFIEPIIKAAVQRDILTDKGIIVLESDSGDEHGDFDGLETYRRRKYGRTYITVYKKITDIAGQNKINV